MPEPSGAAPSVFELLTPPGRGAVAVLAFRGDLRSLDGLFAAANGVDAAAQEINVIRYGQWRGGDAPAEDVVFVRVASDRAELHCHGGPAAVGRIMRDLSTIGAAVGDAAFPSPVEAELAAALVRATTRLTAHHLLNQSSRFPAFLRELETLSRAERRGRIEEALRWSRFGEGLTRPWRVVLCGLPNVGKSSLINSLMGYSRAIVSDRPGTTRDVVSSETAFDGWPVELSDTAGLRESSDVLETEGITRARRSLAAADHVLVVLDVSTPLSQAAEALVEDHPAATLVLNKCDLPSRWEPDRFGREAYLVSAATGSGIDTLTAHLARTLVPREPPWDAAFPVTPEQRERLLRLRDEAGEEGARDQGPECDSC